MSLCGGSVDHLLGIRVEERVMREIIVQKFGSSVLPGRDHLARAVDEIYGAVRAGKHVVAVVSAFGDTTDRLLAQARAFSSEPDWGGLASLVATGEATAASYLVLALERAGIQAELFDSARAGLLTKGEPLNAQPVALDTQALRAAFSDASVIVLPGFVGRDSRGSQTLLGRGGSDLTALFVAEQLGAECVLFKDVDGYYSSDPKVEGGGAERYENLSWQSALEIGADVVQSKAIGFSRECGQSFHVTAPGCANSTKVGHVSDSLAPVSPSSSPTRVVLLGCGTVGVGVLQRLLEIPAQFEVVAVLVQEMNKVRDITVPPCLLQVDAEAALAQPHDIVIEVLGSVALPLELIEKSLEAGRSVVTANKEVIAYHGARLEKLAASRGGQLLYGGAVGGAVPCVETAVRLRASSELRAAVGVLNGTTNYVLDAMADGQSFPAAVFAAQEAGFAEADPRADLRGDDVARKLSILIRRAFQVHVAPDDIRTEGIESITAQDVARARDRGEVIRLVAECRQSPTGVDAWIAPRHFPESHPLAQVRAESNALTFYGDHGPLETVAGKGAGRFPTAQAVMGDLWQLLRARESALAKESATAKPARVHYLQAAKRKACAS